MNNTVLAAAEFGNASHAVRNQMMTIVVTSDEPWCDVWHTQLHYSYQLSRRALVLFLGPPEPWKFGNLWSFGKKYRPISDTLIEFSYHNFLPAAFGKLSMRINDLINEYRLRSYLTKHRKADPELIWHFDHFRSYFLFRNKRAKHVFHVIDPIQGSAYDAFFSSSADVVIVTSPKFTLHYEKLNRNVLQLPQGVDTGMYSVKGTVSGDVPQDTILLLGTLTDDVDYHFLNRIAELYPGKLLIIGPDKILQPANRAARSGLINTGSVTWMGAMSPAAFMPYLHSCSFGIIAYIGDSLVSNNLRSPLKVISYLAAGKPVISNIDCEIPELEGKAIYKCEDDHHFLELIAQGIQGNLYFDQAAVDKYLERIDYDHLLKRIFNNLNLSLPEKLK